MFVELIRELLFADNAVFLVQSQTDIRHIMDLFPRACNASGLNISLKKTKVMFTPDPGEPYIEPNITITRTRLNVVDTFIYLGSTVLRDGSLDAEIYSCISKASLTFGKLEKRVWVDRDITINTKISVCKTGIITVLLYSAETWTTYKIHIKLLECFHQKCLRCILNIKWQTYTPDTTVLKKADCPNT